MQSLASLPTIALNTLNRNWGPVVVLSTQVMLTTLSFEHAWSKGGNNDNDMNHHARPWAKKILWTCIAASLLPFHRLINRGIPWDGHAYARQLACPVLGVGAASYALWNHSDDASSNCWIGVVQSSAIALGMGLAMTLTAEFSVSPTWTLGIATALTYAGYGYQYWNSSTNKEALSATTSIMVGTAAAAALKMMNLLGSRFALGTLLQGREAQLITAGQSAVLAGSLLCLADPVRSACINQEGL